MAGKSVAAAREQLQLLVGNNLAINLENFVNRVGTQYRNAVIAVRPKTVNEVQTVLRACQSLRLRVRAVSSASCLAPLFAEENQVALYTNHLQRHDGPKIELHKNEFDPTMSELTAMCHVTMHELLEFQMANGVELPANSLQMFCTVGGSVATMTHGVGIHVQTISDLVVRMRIIDSSGDLRVYDLTNPELLDAARGSLGLFGIIYDVTFRVTPLSVVQVENRWILASHVFYERNFLAGLVHNNVSCQLFWWPLSSLSKTQRLKALVQKHVEERLWYAGNDEVWVRTVNRPVSPPEDVSQTALNIGTYWHGWSFKKNKWFSQNMPSTCSISLHKHKDAMKNQFNGVAVQPVPVAVHFYGDIDENPKWEMEFVFNHDTDCVNIQAAIMAMIELLDEEAGEGSYPINLPVEIGVTGASSVYLAPSHAGHPNVGGSGYAAYIKLSSFVGTEGWREFCVDLVKRWLRIPGIRPSWRHQWSFIPDINSIISQNCQPAIAKFRDVLQLAQCDPGRLFFTKRLEEIILGGPASVTMATPGDATSQLVVPSHNHHQQLPGQIVAAPHNQQLVQQINNGQVTVVQGAPNCSALPNGLMAQHQQLLANPNQGRTRGQTARDKIMDFLHRKKDKHPRDDVIVTGPRVVTTQVPQQPSMVSQQPQQVVLIKNQNGSLVQQQVIHQGISQPLPQQGIPQQVIQTGIPRQAVTQRAIQQGLPQQGIPRQVIQQSIPQQSIPQQVIQQGIPKQVIQQGIPQQVIQQGIPQQGMPQQRMITIQTPGGVPNQKVGYFQAGSHAAGSQMNGVVPQQGNQVYIRQ